MNILIIAMSTLPGFPGKKEFARNIPERTCDWQDKSGGIHTMKYYSQLEPVTRMLTEQGDRPDEVLVMCTKESCEEDIFKLSGSEEEKHLSACEFYKERIDKDIRVKKIPEQENEYVNPNSADSKKAAVAEIAGYVLNKKKENKNLKIWIDTQGAFRDISLLTNAIFSLLKPSKIMPQGIFSINFVGEGKNKIMDQTDTYQIFDFVSGMNEFIEYGRADQLMKYYDKVKKEVPKVVDTMKELADAIMFCDVNKMDKKLSQLRTDIKDADAEDVLLSIFIEQIKNDYGKVLEENATKLDVIEWLKKKKMYQQLLTYIESKILEEWEEKEILVFKSETKITPEMLSTNMPSVLSNEMNCYMGAVLKSAEIAKNTDKVEVYHSWKKYVRTKWSCVKKNVTINFPNKDNKKAEIVVSTKATNEKLWNKQILLYRLLKSERNAWNHMLDEQKMEIDTLNYILDRFIQNGRQLYDDVAQNQ